jgi:hypothetical protein
VNDTIDPKIVTRVRTKEDLTPPEHLDDVHLEYLEQLQGTQEHTDGIFRLLGNDLFRALLMLNIINAAVYLYYHVKTQDVTISQTQSIAVLESFFPQNPTEVALLTDIANLHGSFKSTQLNQLDALSQKMISLIPPEEGIVIDETTPSLQFETKHGGYVWLGKP